MGSLEAAGGSPADYLNELGAEPVLDYVSPEVAIGSLAAGDVTLSGGQDKMDSGRDDVTWRAKVADDD